MGTQDAEFLEVGEGRQCRRIAYSSTPARTPGRPGLVWLPGFLSDMASTKASVLADWADRTGHGMIRFDYSGHGASPGKLTDCTVGHWLEETLAVLRRLARGPQVLVGSSMGGWIALLTLRALARAEGADFGRVMGCVLIAPAWDMTEELMWNLFPPEAREAIERDGVVHRPSDYGDPYPITRTLIEEGRKHLLAATPFDPGCPVRILHGCRDADVPWRHSLPLLDLLQGDDVHLVLVKDGEHRLSRPADLELLVGTVESLCEALAPA